MKDAGPFRAGVFRLTAQAIYVILVSAGDCRLIRLRGGRSSADGARGTCPSGLPSIACGRGGYARSSVLLRPAKRTAGRRGGCGKSFRMWVYHWSDQLVKLTFRTKRICILCIQIKQNTIYIFTGIDFCAAFQFAHFMNEEQESDHIFL